MYQQQCTPARVESRVVGIPPVATATVVPAKMPVRIKPIDINDLYDHMHIVNVHGFDDHGIFLSGEKVVATTVRNPTSL